MTQIRRISYKPICLYPFYLCHPCSIIYIRKSFAFKLKTSLNLPFFSFKLDNSIQKSTNLSIKMKIFSLKIVNSMFMLKIFSVKIESFSLRMKNFSIKITYFIPRLKKSAIKIAFLSHEMNKFSIRIHFFPDTF